MSYGTGNILPTLFQKAFGPSNSTFLLVFHALTVCDTASFSALVIELPLKGRIVIIKIMKKNKGNRACFCGRACRSCAPPTFLTIFEGGLGRVSKRHVRGRWKKAMKISILWNLTQLTQLGHSVTKMKLKCHESSGSPQHLPSKASERKFNSATRVPLTKGTFPTL